VPQVGRRQHQSDCQLQQQVPRLHRPAESADRSHEVPQNRHPANDRHESAPNFERCSDPDNDSDELSSGSEADCDEDKVELWSERGEVGV
jgi:hypothetical protein